MPVSNWLARSFADEIKPEACREWAAKLSQEIACHYYNNTIATLRWIIAAGIEDMIEFLAY
jgi:hypothetical protein